MKVTLLSVILLRFIPFLFLYLITSLSADKRPNILWIITDDQSKHFGFNGESLVKTPILDKMAAEGAIFKNAAVTAPVCSTARSSLITGMFQTSIGAHHHRSGRGVEKIELPKSIKMVPQYFKEAGYYTSIASISHFMGGKKSKKGFGKTDYNFEWDKSVYDSALWDGKEKDQPFFAQVQLKGGKARSQARAFIDIPHVDVKDVVLPPYYPEHPTVREDWAAYLDTFTLVDYEVGLVIDKLKKEGEFENTIIFFITDHGVSHARGKQFCYDEGMMIPFVVYAPGRINAGTVRTDLTMHIDMAASSLYFAGIEIPNHMESNNLFGPSFRSRSYLVSARDRCDETVDRIRALRTHDFKYIRNGFPERPQLQPCAYKDNKDIYKALRSWEKEGKLNELQQELLFAPTRAKEELYDLNNDPWELNNLADNPEYANELKKMSGSLDSWITQTGDQGQEHESMAMFESDMKIYYDTILKKMPERAEEIKRNIDLMKKWRKEGK